MTSTVDPAVGAAAQPDGQDVVAALRRHGVRDVDDSTLRRGLMSTDASLYRVVPQVVVSPRDTDEVIATLAAARETGTPLTMRGAGTSIAGNAMGPGIVLDTRTHLHQVLDLDVEAGRARVQPGLVHADLQRVAGPHGWRFGPDPSTHTRCTIGGMIGNNACGSRALGYGRTSDNVVDARLLLADGTVLDTARDLAAQGDAAAAVERRLTEFADAHLGDIRPRFGQFGRQVSGYALEQLLPENGRRIDRLIAGSEGTLAVVLDATVSLVREPAARAVAVLGYADMAAAADAVPALLHHDLIACEGLGQGIVDVVRSRPGSSVPDLPAGGGWLIAEVVGDSREEAHAAAEAVARTAGVPHRVVSDVAEQAALWRIREDGAGLAARSLERPCHAGWEDAAVPPARLGDYLRDFERLLGEHDLGGIPYGHFGEGCVHVRIDFPLAEDGGRGDYRRFVEEAADLVASHGGSLSGEHGDGRARSELLPRMYDETAVAMFRGLKHLMDPGSLLNPGVLVDPDPLDAAIRVGGHRSPLPRTRLRLIEDGGSIDRAAHRCTGVGKCVAVTKGPGVMCPSYDATRNERDSTRGRARVLQEMLDGRLVEGGWDAPEVHEALDLCLSCKGCASDCPTGVDMAAYKAEALHQRFQGRRRPRSHYVLGRLPLWARLTAPVAPLANASLKVPAVARVARTMAGVDQRRSLPRFATWTLRRMAPKLSSGVRPDVWVWADSFTDHFAPEGGVAAVRLLESLGLTVGVIPDRACCGLTWISTGQLDEAARIVGDAVATLHPYVASGVPVLGLEPSCLATLRTEAEQLIDDPRVADVAAGVRTLAEILADVPGWTPPDLTGTTVVAQPHCHHHAVLGWKADEALLRSTGAEVVRVGGCCGLAGNFGVEEGHYEVSVAVAEQQLLPAVRSAPEGAVVLADGFSCRTQLDDLAGVRALHLAELLAGAR